MISNNPGKLRALEEAGLEIVERVAIEIPPHETATKYLQTKKEKLGHLLEFETAWLDDSYDRAELTARCSSRNFSRT